MLMYELRKFYPNNISFDSSVSRRNVNEHLGVVVFDTPVYEISLGGDALFVNCDTGVIGNLYFSNVSSNHRIPFRPDPDTVCRQFRRLRRNAEMAHSQFCEFGSR